MNVYRIKGHNRNSQSTANSVAFVGPTSLNLVSLKNAP